MVELIFGQWQQGASATQWRQKQFASGGGHNAGAEPAENFLTYPFSLVPPHEGPQRLFVTN